MQFCQPLLSQQGRSIFLVFLKRTSAAVDSILSKTYNILILHKYLQALSVCKVYKRAALFLWMFTTKRQD